MNGGETQHAGYLGPGVLTGGPAFTHTFINDYQIIYGMFTNQEPEPATRLVPTVFYRSTFGPGGDDGKCGARRKAQAEDREIPMTRVARAADRAERRVSLTLIFERRGLIAVLGCAAILAARGAELVQILMTCCLARRPYTLLKAHSIFPDPGGVFRVDVVYNRYRTPLDVHALSSFTSPSSVH